MTKVLITGGSGMVGQGLLLHRKAKAFTVFAPTRSELDLEDFTAVVRYVDNIKPDFIIHCAGLVGGIATNALNQAAFLMQNFAIGKNVLTAAKELGVKNLINLGSSCMYPSNSFEKMNEEMIFSGRLEPTNEGYALAKISIARLCHFISQENKSFRFKSVIPCNLYGPNDKFDIERAHLVPAIISKIHHARSSGDTQVEIWGDGTARREFMYVEDLAACLWRGVQHFDTLPDIMNVGPGYDYSVKDYYEAVAKEIGFAGQFTLNTSKPVGMKRKLLDVQKMLSWGWAPETDLEFGIKLTYRYWLNAREKVI